MSGETLRAPRKARNGGRACPTCGGPVEGDPLEPAASLGYVDLAAAEGLSVQTVKRHAADPDCPLYRAPVRLRSRTRVFTAAEARDYRAWRVRVV